jgi:NADPH:quinone reductase-like Zn-dependent oxidoreductase
VFATAIYALSDCANLKSGETVLIHSGAGGVGIAAIQIAHLKGAEVFTTVSTQEKKDYLVKNLGVKRENIFNSRDSSFLPAIMAVTNNHGVDVVLNSLTGDLLHDSFRACARLGRFVEIGKKDLTDAGRLDMHIFKRNVSYTAFDVSELCDADNKRLNVVWER